MVLQFLLLRLAVWVNCGSELQQEIVVGSGLRTWLRKVLVFGFGRLILFFQLRTPFFFLFLFFCQIPQALFILIIRFCHTVSIVE